MLIIRRRVGERIVIGSNIEVTVASASKRVVRLAIAAPKGIPVLRGEVHEAVVAANRAATTAVLEMEEPESNDSELEESADDTRSAEGEAPVHAGAAQQEMRS